MALLRRLVTRRMKVASAVRAAHNAGEFIHQMNREMLRRENRLKAGRRRAKVIIDEERRSRALAKS